MGITNLGAVGISAGGVYNPETVYKKYKVVSANGGSYMYINSTPAAGVPVTDTSHWQQIATVGGQDLVDAAVAARDAATAQAALAQGYAAQLAAGLLRPKGTYADLSALNAGTPTVADTDEIYITLDDGKWCYHNGSAFVAGGVYQAASVVGDIASINSRLDDLFGSELLVSPHLQWEQGSLSSSGGGPMDSDNRIRSDFKQIAPLREIVIKIKDGYEILMYEYNESGKKIGQLEDFLTEVNYVTNESTSFIRLMVRRSGTPLTSSNTEDRITPEDIHDTNITMYLTPDSLPAISEALARSLSSTDDMQKVNKYINLTSSNDLIELDMYSNRNFEVDVKDSTTKHVTFRNLHKIKGNLISRVLKINLHSGASIEFPENIKWQSDSPLELLDGYTHLILFQSFDGGSSWIGAVTSWEISNRVVFDDFNRPNQLGLGSALTGQQWQYTPTSIWEIDNGKAKVHTFRSDDDDDTTGYDIAYIESGVANAKVTAVVEDSSSMAIRIIVRLKDIYNYILIGRVRAVGDPDANRIGIFRVENGTQYEMGSGPTTAPFKIGDTLTAELNGSSIRAFHNGALVYSRTVTFNQTETKHGIVSREDKNRCFYTFLVEGV